MDKRAYYRQPDVADQYEEVRFSSSAGQKTQAVELGVLSSVFSAPRLVLDIACGTTRILRALRAQGVRVVGVDQSEMMLGQSKTPELLVQGNAFNLPFKNNCFEGAYCFRFTNHFKDLGALFIETHRVLKPGASFVFDSMRWSPLIWDYAVAGGKNFFHPPQAVRIMLKDIGFHVVDHSPLFSISPYLMAHLPGDCVDWIHRLRQFFHWPAAIEVWHVRKE